MNKKYQKYLPFFKDFLQNTVCLEQKQDTLYVSYPAFVFRKYNFYIIMPVAGQPVPPLLL